MDAVILEVSPKEVREDGYLKIATKVKSFLNNRQDFISIEIFQSLADED